MDPHQSQLPIHPHPSHTWQAQIVNLKLSQYMSIYILCLKNLSNVFLCFLLWDACFSTLLLNVSTSKGDWSPRRLQQSMLFLISKGLKQQK